MYFPLLNDLKAAKEVIWYNDNYTSFTEIKNTLPISFEDILEAENRLKRFAPYIKKIFPEVADGIIESPYLKLIK